MSIVTICCQNEENIFLICWCFFDLHLFSEVAAHWALSATVEWIIYSVPRLLPLKSLKSYTHLSSLRSQKVPLYPMKLYGAFGEHVSLRFWIALAILRCHTLISLRSADASRTSLISNLHWDYYTLVGITRWFVSVQNSALNKFLALKNFCAVSGFGLTSTPLISPWVHDINRYVCDWLQCSRHKKPGPHFDGICYMFVTGGTRGCFKLRFWDFDIPQR